MRPNEPPPAEDYYQQILHWNIDQKIYHTTCVIVSLTIVGCVLVHLKFILVPLTLAFFFTYFLTPLVDLLTLRPWAWASAYLLQRAPPPRLAGLQALRPALDFLVRFKFPKWLAVISSFAITFLFLTGVAAVIVYSLDEFMARSGKYVHRLHAVSAVLSSYASQLGLGNPRSREKLLEYFVHLPLGALVAEGMHALLRVAMEAAMVMIVVVYLLLGNTEAEKSAIRREIDAQVRQYIVLKGLISASFGLLQCLILLALGVDLAVVFGLLCFVLNFVPNVGPIIAILLPVPVVLLDPDRTWLTRSLALLLPALLSFVVGWIVEPSFFGSSMQLNEITVLVSLVFWGALWGVAGAVLSVPLLVVMKICLEKVDHPIAELMLRGITGLDPPRPFHLRPVRGPSLPAGTAPLDAPPPCVASALSDGFAPAPLWVKATN